MSTEYEGVESSRRAWARVPSSQLMGDETTIAARGRDSQPVCRTFFKALLHDFYLLTRETLRRHADKR